MCIKILGRARRKVCRTKIRKYQYVVKLCGLLMTLILIMGTVSLYKHSLLYPSKEKIILCPSGYLSNTEDLLCMMPLRFNSSFKNPCWYDEFKSLKCLPYVIIAGMSKCGSTDLFASLRMHPDFESPDNWKLQKGRRKEMQFFDVRHFEDSTNTNKYYSFTDYVDCFRPIANRILADNTFETTITGEATPGYFWRFHNWKKYPQNKELTFPKFVVPDLIHHLIPDVKLVFIFREPAERTRSHFFFYRENATEEEFNNHIDKELKKLNQCLQYTNIDQCIGLDDSWSYNILKDNCIRPSIYAFFLREWFRVFPRRQFYFIKLDDYEKNKQAELNKLFKFLTLRELSAKEMVQNGIHFNGKKNKDETSITVSKINGTLSRLRSFFKPFNQDFVSLVKESKFKSFI